MQVSVEAGEGLERRMRVDLTPEQVDSEVGKRLQQIARTARLPGFRPGKVPMKILRQRFGEQVQHEVFGDLVQSSFSDAVTREALRPAGLPRIDPEIDTEARRYGYTATFEVLPKIELAPLTGRIVKRPVSEVTDADFEAMIERLRTQRKTWSPVDRESRPGDQLTVSFTGTMDGEPFEGGSGEDVRLELGSGRMIPGFEDGLIGAGAGEQRTLDLAFPGDYPAKHLAGKPVRFEITVAGVAEPVLPEVDEEFARAFGIENGDVERFRADVRANMERELRQRVDARVKGGVMDLLLEANAIDLPAVLIKEEIRSLKEQVGQGVRGGGMGLPDNLFEDSARRRVALGLIVAEIVREQGIQADPERVRAAVEDLASTYERPEEVIGYYYGDRKRLSSVESLVLEDKVVDWVLGQVTVEDEPISFGQLTAPASGD